MADRVEVFGGTLAETTFGVFKVALAAVWTCTRFVAVVAYEFDSSLARSSNFCLSSCESLNTFVMLGFSKIDGD